MADEKDEQDKALKKAALALDEAVAEVERWRRVATRLDDEPVNYGGEEPLPSGDYRSSDFDDLYAARMKGDARAGQSQFDRDYGTGRFNPPPPPQPASTEQDRNNGGKMNSTDERVAKLEGTISTQQWAMGIVSAVLIGAMGILVAITLNLSANVGELSAKVDALPGQISEDIQQIVSTLSSAITATQGGNATPNIIVIPGAATPPPVQPTPQNFTASPLPFDGSGRQFNWSLGDGSFVWTEVPDPAIADDPAAAPDGTSVGEATTDGDTGVDG